MSSNVINSQALVNRRAETAQKWLNSSAGAEIVRFVMDWEIAEGFKALIAPDNSVSARLLVESYYLSDPYHCPEPSDEDEDMMSPAELYKEYKPLIIQRFTDAAMRKSNGKGIRTYEESFRCYQMISGRVGRFLVWAAKDKDLAPAVMRARDRYEAIHGEPINGGLYDLIGQAENHAKKSPPAPAPKVRHLSSVSPSGF